jgi:hypothetical protein
MPCRISSQTRMVVRWRTLGHFLFTANGYSNTGAVLDKRIQEFSKHRRRHAATQARVVQGQAAKLRVVRIVVPCGALQATWHWD